MIFDYIRRKKLNNITDKVYYNLDKFKEYYGFELRDVNPLNSINYNLDYIKTNIKDFCKIIRFSNLRDNSLIFNHFKLQIEDLEEVVENLPFQLFFPLFEYYFPEIKEFFLKEFIDNGINHTYEEVKNHIVNHMDMRFIVDPMNIAIKKTLSHVFGSSKSNKMYEIYDQFNKICKKTWFGDEHDSKYELSLYDFFNTYQKCVDESRSLNRDINVIIPEGIISSLIIYLWYVTCDYFYNSNETKISYIRTDVEMFYMRNLHNNSCNYNYFNVLKDRKQEIDIVNIESWFNYYSGFVDFANMYLGNEKTKFFNLVKTVSEWKTKYKTMVSVPAEESLKLMADLDELILIISKQVESRKNNSLTFDPLDRLIECVVDPTYNSVEECRPKIYLDLATPESEYINKKGEKNDN